MAGLILWGAPASVPAVVGFGEHAVVDSLGQPPWLLVEGLSVSDDDRAWSRVSGRFIRGVDSNRPTGQAVAVLKQNHYDQILSAALTVFHERGFHDSGTQDIVTLAGVSKGSFYNHFKSKDALGLAVLEHYWESHQPLLSLLRASDQEPLERIETYFRSVAYDERGCLIGNFSSELAGSDAFRERLATLFGVWVSEIATCISDGQRAGTIRNDDSATTLAEFVTTSYEGAILKAKVDRDPAVLERFRHSILSFLKRN